MEDINCWQEKFTPCQYSDKLLNRVNFINNKVRSPVDLNEITKAIYYAKKYHGSQIRQSGEVYYSHPIEVAYMVSAYLPRTDIIVSSILHDCIEDTLLTKLKISSIFGDMIAEQVMDLTRIKEDGRKISSAELIEILYLEKKYDIAFIKIFDRIHNLQTLHVKSHEKANKIIEETLTHVVALSMKLQIPMIKRQIIELCYQHLRITQPLVWEWRKIVDGIPYFLAPIYQNDVNQICNQCLLES